MKTEKTIDVLNTLVEINNDRIEGYETALKETKEADLKVLFARLMKTSEKCKTELVNEIQKMGGTPIEGTKITGKFFRVWMDVKVALSTNDRKVILNSCEYGEDVAVDTYDKALRDHMEDISSEQKDMLNAQQLLIKSDHDEVKRLRNMLIEQN